MYTVRINSRKLMDFIMKEYLRLNGVQMQSISKLIDRMHKMDHAEFEAEVDGIFTPSQRDSGSNNRLLGLLKIKQLHHLPEVIREHESAKELKRLMDMLDDVRVTNVVFDITIMRGFDYYTGIVFEIFDTRPDNNRSMMGGGRYDGLVGLFGVEPVPTVGFGWGDVTMQNFLEGHDLLPNLRPDTDLYIVLIGDVFSQAQRVIQDLRDMGVNVAVDLTDRKPDKQIKTAVKKGIHYAMFVGQKELEDEQYEIRNLMTGVAERHSTARIASIVTDYREEDL